MFVVLCIYFSSKKAKAPWSFTSSLERVLRRLRGAVNLSYLFLCGQTRLLLLQGPECTRDTNKRGGGGEERQLQADRLHRRQGGERADATNEAASIGYNSIMRNERQLTIEISESNDAAWLCVAKSRTLPEVSAGIAPANQ